MERKRDGEKERDEMVELIKKVLAPEFFYQRSSLHLISILSDGKLRIDINRKFSFRQKQGENIKKKLHTYNKAWVRERERERERERKDHKFSYFESVVSIYG